MVRTTPAHFFCTAGLALLSWFQQPTQALAVTRHLPVEFLNLREADIRDAARLIASLTGAKIVTSNKTAGSVVDLFVRDAEVTDCLKLICRSTGLVYRYDEESDIFTILTLEEYRQNLQIDTDGLYQTKVFHVEPANVTQIARALENVYPNQVIFTEGEQIEDFSSAPGQGGGVQGLGNSDSDSGAVGGRSTSRNQRSVNTGMGRSNGISNSRQSNLGNNLGNNLGSGTGIDPRRQRAELINPEDALAVEGVRAGVPATNGRTLAPGDATIFVTTNLEHNQIIVRTSNEVALRQIEKLVVQLDQPVPQVILEMKILQLNVGNGRKIGVDFNFGKGADNFGVTERDPATGAPTAFEFLGRAQQFAMAGLATEAAAGFVYTYLSRDIQARIQLLASNNKVEVVATPMLIGTNNRSAKIEVGEERIITVGASTDTSIAGETGARSELINLETEKRTIGVTLRILPRINTDGTVTLFVEQESTTLKPRNNRLLVGTREVPIDSVDTANISATVVAKSGNTVAVGGLIRNENANDREKIPILGDIPLLGKLFGKESLSRNKSELILLITPTIIDAGPKARAKTQELMGRLSDHSYHATGEAFIEDQNAELQAHRAEQNAWIEAKEQTLIREQKLRREQAAGRAPVVVTKKTTTVVRPATSKAGK